MTATFQWFAGIDWGETSHYIFLVDAAGKTRGKSVFSHSGAGLADMVRWIRKETKGARDTVAVALERSDGPVVATLLKAGFQVHSINPRQADRFRDRFAHAGSKNDSLDARVLASALLTDTHLFRSVRLPRDLIVRLRERTASVDGMRRDRLRICQRVRSRLMNYFPAMLKVAGGLEGLHRPFFLELWDRAPTPKRARRLHRATLEGVFRRYRIRRMDAADAHALLREEALTVAPGATEAAEAHIRSALSLVKILNQEIARGEKETAQLLEALREDLDTGEEPDPVTIARSMKGLGDQTLARLCAFAFEVLRRGDYRALRAACGVAPIFRQWGNSSRVAGRRTAPVPLRNAAHAFARGLVCWDPGVKAYNEKLKKSGKNCPRRYRSIADRQFRVLCAMQRNRTLFDPKYRERWEGAA